MKKSMYKSKKKRMKKSKAMPRKSYARLSKTSRREEESYESF